MTPVLNLSSIHGLLTTCYTSNSTSTLLQFHTSNLKIPNLTNKYPTFPSLSCYPESNSSSLPETSSPSETAVGTIPPVKKKRPRNYRRPRPGEKKGISEEMRFVAMGFRRKTYKDNDSSDTKEEIDAELDNADELISPGATVSSEETWVPTVEGFVNYLVNSKLIFDTLEGIVDDSSNVSYVYFRNTGLERSESLSKDLEWFRQQDVVIPEPSRPGIIYAKYLKELSEKQPPLFLSHFYNIYLSHIAGGQVITKEVSKRIFKGKKLEFCEWQGNEEELLKGVRENLNILGEHWSRNEKKKCLAETKKVFQYVGKIVRLIIV